MQDVDSNDLDSIKPINARLGQMVISIFLHLFHLAANVNNPIWWAYGPSELVAWLWLVARLEIRDESKNRGGNIVYCAQKVSNSH